MPNRQKSRGHRHTRSPKAKFAASWRVWASTHLNAVAVRFQVVADLTSGSLKGRIHRLKPSDLLLIKQIAGESGNEDYRRIMAAIIAAVGQGPRGVNTAHLTASRAVELSFRWTREYFSALDRYRKKLRRLRRTVETL